MDKMAQTAAPRILEWIGPALLASLTGLAALRSAQSKSDEILAAQASLGSEIASRLNLGLVRDTTLDNSQPPELGHRYRVQLAEPARWEVGAIARVGGRVVVVPDTVPGDVCVIEVTGQRGAVFDAKVVGPTPARVASPTGTAPAVASGILITGVIESVGSRGDGRLRAGGRVIYVPGTGIGDRVVVEIVRDYGTYSVGRLVQEITNDTSMATSSHEMTSFSPAAATLVTGVVEGVGSRGDGRLRWQGLPLYVPDTKPGETVVVEIVRHTDRYAIGRWVQKFGSSSALTGTSSNAPAAVASTALQPGMVLDVEITEPARRAPERDGVARVNGFPVIVPGTQPGQKVRIRITQVHERVAYGLVESGGPSP